MSEALCELCGDSMPPGEDMFKFHGYSGPCPKPPLVKNKTPIKPGFYWALWLTAANGTHEGDQLTPSKDWEVVEVWENFVGDPCEADKAEKFGVSVPGVRESQWLENFKWGNEVVQ
jgi:hypothetical protein